MKILGVKIDNLDIGEVLERVEDFLKDDKQHYLVTPNPEFLVEAQKDKEFKEILNQADLAVPDGIGLIFASWFLGQPLKERVQGVDLMEQVCQKAARNNWSVFLLGGERGISQKAADNLKEKYPNLKIRAGFERVFGQPDILFVALGAPKQEKWIRDNLAELSSIRLAVGVGGSFDYISGRVKRAPRIIQNIGLEWFWRLGCQPWRVRRIYKAVIKFPWLVVKSRYHFNR